MIVHRPTFCYLVGCWSFFTEMDKELVDPLRDALIRGDIEMCGWTLTERALAVPILDVAKRAAAELALEELKNGAGKIRAIARGRDVVLLAVLQIHTVFTAMRHFTSETHACLTKQLVVMDQQTGIVQMLWGIARELSDSLRASEPVAQDAAGHDALYVHARSRVVDTIRERIASMQSVSTPEQWEVAAPILAGAEDAILTKFDAHGDVMCARCSAALCVREFAKYTAACEEAVKAIVH